VTVRLRQPQLVKGKVLTGSRAVFCSGHHAISVVRVVLIGIGARFLSDARWVRRNLARIEVGA